MGPPQRHHPRLDLRAIWWGQVAGRELWSASPPRPPAAYRRSHPCTVCRATP
jgi:hypothetical protein